MFAAFHNQSPLITMMKHTSYRHTGIIKTTSWPPHRHKRTGTSLSPHRLKTKTQADSLTGNKLQSHSHTGVIQKLQARRHTGNKTTNLLRHRHRTKLQACRHTGVRQNYKLQLPHRQQNYKLDTTQAQYKTTCLPPQ